MKKSLQEMFSKSSYTVLQGNFIYAKVGKIPAIKNHFMVTKDDDEITVITTEENLHELELIEKNEHLWKLISLNLAIPFTAGTLAAINSACAKSGLNNLVVSTYSKDYILVKQKQLEKAKEVFETLGFKQES